MLDIFALIVLAALIVVIGAIFLFIRSEDLELAQRDRDSADAYGALNKALHSAA